MTEMHTERKKPEQKNHESGAAREEHTEIRIEDLQKIIGYKFRNIRLLYNAMSHSSYANEHRFQKWKDNERIEFLGDAVLELSSSTFLYKMHPEMPEGDLTKLRASLVCEPTLAMCARAFGLQDYILLGRGEEQTGGRNRNSIVSDALESLIGAIYLDGGYKPANEFILKFILNDYQHKKLFYDSKTILQEVVQKDFKEEEITYAVIGEEGPDHAKHFIVRCVIGGREYATGRGSTKKAAEMVAAYNTLLMMTGPEKEVPSPYSVDASHV